MNIDTYDNCNHTYELSLQVQYFHHFEQEQDQEDENKPKIQDYDTQQELYIKLKNLKSESKSKPQLKTPLDYLKSQIMNKIDNLLQFQQMQIFTNITLMKNFGKPKAIHYANELILGGSLGNILIDNLIIQQTNKYGSVSAIDSHDTHILIGYENGSIAIIQRKRFIKNCQEVHSSKIIILKFLYSKDNEFSTISGDIEGRTRITHFTQNVLEYDYNPQLALIKQQYPFTSIIVLNEQQSQKFISSQDDFRIVLLCSLAKLLVVQIFTDRDKKLNSLLEIENPQFTSPERPFYCSVQFGYSYFPFSKEEQQIILLTWNSHLYIIIRIENGFTTLKPLLFPKKECILLAYMIGDSTIQLITQRQNIYFFSTKDLDLVHRPKSINQISYQIQKKTWTDQMMSSLYNVEEKNDEGISYQKQFPLYQQAYTYTHKQLYILNESFIVIGTINNFEQAVDIYIQNKDWSKAMYLVMCVKEGTLKFSPIQLNQETLNKKVLEIATHYIKMVMDQIKVAINICGTFKYFDGMSQKQKIEIDKIKSFFSLLIDFILRTCSRVLFDQVYQVLKQFLNGDISLFCDELTGFLNNNRVNNVITKQSFIIEIIEYYLNKKENQSIENLIYGLDEKQETEEIVSICLKHKLTKSLSYLCSRQGDFLTPLAKLWGIMKIEMKNNLQQVIEQGKNIIVYLEEALQNKKFNVEIEDQIALWLFEESTLLELMSIDLISSFQLIYKFFLSDSLLGQRLIKYCQNVISVLHHLTQQKDAQLQSLITIQMKTINNITWDKLVHALSSTYKALMIISGHLEIDQDKIKFQKLLIDLMQDTKHRIHLPLFALKFPKITNNDEQTLNYCLTYAYNQILIDLANKNKNCKLEKEELINIAAQGDFDLFQIYLEEKYENYNRALDLRIKVNQLTTQLNLKDNDNSIFQWIKMILQTQPNNQQFKDRIIYHIGALVSFAAIQTRQIIATYFEASDLSILDKLGGLPHLQLEYVQYILKIDKNNQNESNVDLLKLYIRLLCQLKPHKVLDELKENQYPLDEMISICRAYKVPDALVYLLERSGAIQEAVQVKLLDFKDKIMNKQFTNQSQFLLSFNQICDLCVRNRSLDETLDCWDNVASTFVSIASDKLTPLPLNTYLDDQIPIFFKKWAECTDLDAFLDKVTAKYIKLSSSKLKRTFASLYSHITFQEFIFQKIYDINYQKVVEYYYRLVRGQHRGQSFFHGCYQCMKQIEEDEEQIIVLMACGHLFHFNCLQLDEKSIYHCPICLNDPNILIRQQLHALKFNKHKLIEQQIKGNYLHQLVPYIIKEGQQRQKDLEKVQKMIQQQSNNKNQIKIDRLRNYESKIQEKVNIITQPIKY